ncbi:MAG TPA: hypothetical protein DCK93_04615 [Blastocatellia bacterium]|jgi:hypothetical protein|nr:hypothetical protein [Blastocatellia bacterium]
MKANLKRGQQHPLKRRLKSTPVTFHLEPVEVASFKKRGAAGVGRPSVEFRIAKFGFRIKTSGNFQY